MFGVIFRGVDFDEAGAYLTLSCPLEPNVHTTMYIRGMDEQLFQDWRHKRDLIQNLFPDLSSTVREFLITGMDQTTQDKIFKYADDE